MSEHICLYKVYCALALLIVSRLAIIVSISMFTCLPVGYLIAQRQHAVSVSHGNRRSGYSRGTNCHWVFKRPARRPGRWLPGHGFRQGRGNYPSIAVVSRGGFKVSKPASITSALKVCYPVFIVVIAARLGTVCDTRTT